MILDLKFGGGDICDPGQFDMLAKLYAQSGMGFTWIEGETVLACAGIHLLWPGVGAVWSFLSHTILRRHPMFLLKSARRRLDFVVAQLKLWRVQTLADPENPASIRWVEWLGFEREGMMRHFGLRGEDLPLYARIYPENLPTFSNHDATVTLQRGESNGSISSPALQTSAAAVGTGVSTLDPAGG